MTAATPTAVVVGGGIAGLACAVGLHQQGWEVSVLERAAGSHVAGAGITLWPNALRALDVLGLGDAVEARGAVQRAGEVRTSRGRRLSTLDGAAMTRELGRPAVAVHRADLQEVLLGALPDDAVRTGVDVVGATADGTVRTARDGDVAADLVVAADGIGGTVRRALWPDAPSPLYTGFTAWRAVSEVPVERVTTTWGAGTEFGSMPIGGGRTYWFAAARAPERERHDDERAHLLDRLAGWPDDVRSLVAGTPADAVLRNDLRRLPRPPRTLVDGRVVLVGDAAHAMAPNLGQGGCQALEDAAVLTLACADAGRHLPERLGWYERERLPRVTAVMRASYWAGTAGPYVTHPVALRVRDALVAHAPASAATRQLVRVGGWRPSRPG
ncbi:FAD-dependent monooxygenase [Actinotalea sp. AC32]|nr:FAD-dependent monooxygenase [Actinotalea sp. AC32]